MNFIGRSGSLLVVALYEAHLSRHTNTVTSAILAVSAASQRAGAHTSTVNSDNQTHAEDPPLPKRFYRTANVQASEKGFEVLLDKRVVKTPAGKPLVLPSRMLALAVAAEWEQQEARVIRPFTMPFMTLSATALDEPKPRADVISTMLGYLHTDAACCREEPGPLADRQAEVFDPVVRWAEDQMEASIEVGSDLMGMQQSERLITSAHAHLHDLSIWQLAAVDAAASAARSVIVGLALVKGQLSVKEALVAARVEEDYQINEWGLVEGGHDIDIADSSARISAAALFSRFIQ